MTSGDRLTEITGLTPWIQRARTSLVASFGSGVAKDEAAVRAAITLKQVMKQTRARIFRGNTRSEGKLLSLFEPSTEVIRKGKAGKPNEFGKMVKLQEAENQIITDYEVYARRPYDSDLLITAIYRTSISKRAAG